MWCRDLSRREKPLNGSDLPKPEVFRSFCSRFPIVRKTENDCFLYVQTIHCFLLEQVSDVWLAGAQLGMIANKVTDVVNHSPGLRSRVSLYHDVHVFRWALQTHDAALVRLEQVV